LRHRRLRELGGRLLAKFTEPLGRLLETRALGRVRDRQHPHREADNERLHTRLQQRDPGGDAEEEVHEANAQTDAAQHEDHGIEADGHRERDEPDRRGVEDADHDERDDVVDDEHREHERAKAVGETRPDDREQTERERGIGRHRRAPPMRRSAPRVEGEVERDRRRSAAGSREQRQREPAALAKLPEIELPPRLETDDEEEQRHQTAVHPVAQVERDAPAVEVDRQGCRPERLVRRRMDVDPGERRRGRCEQHGGASRLRLQEMAKRRLDAARPRRPPTEALVLVRGRVHAPFDCVTPRRR
jgi:hypothetical protein